MSAWHVCVRCGVEFPGTFWVVCLPCRALRPEDADDLRKANERLREILRHLPTKEGS